MTMHRMIWVLATASVLSCGPETRAPTYADLCRTEMAVPSVPPDTSASLRALERTLANTVSARQTADSRIMGPRELLGFLEAWQVRHGVDSYADMLVAFALAEMRGFFPTNYVGTLVQELGEDQFGPERVWSLLAVPPAECVIPNCSVRLLGLATNVVAPRGEAVSEADRSPWYRGGFCRLVAVYTDSTWPTPGQDARELANERHGVISTGYRLLERLAATGSGSDAAFVKKALRAAGGSGDLGREIAEAYDVAMGRR